LQLRAFILFGLCLTVVSCSKPGRMAPDDASLDRGFIERFGLPGDLPPPGSSDRPASPFARSSPWLFFASSRPAAPVIKPPPPIPKPRVEPIPRAPVRGVSWQPNTFEWNGKNFVWQPGRWVPVPPGLVWQYGSWTQTEFGEYVWRTGGWVPPGPPPVFQQATAFPAAPSTTFVPEADPTAPILP
jgi:hypothetical protein